MDNNRSPPAVITSSDDQSFYTTTNDYLINGGQCMIPNMTQYGSQSFYLKPEPQDAQTTTAIATSPTTVSPFVPSNQLHFSANEGGLHSPQFAPSEATMSERRSASISGEIEVNIDDLIELRHHSNASSDSNHTLTPAQRRRKAQNRAAQRALRDRKRQRVQELEEQVTNLSIKTSALQTDNEWLKQQLVHTQTENQILRMNGFPVAQMRNDSLIETPARKAPNEAVAQPICWVDQRGNYVQAGAGLPSSYQSTGSNLEGLWANERPGEEQYNGWVSSSNGTGQALLGPATSQTMPQTAYHNGMMHLTPGGAEHPSPIGSSTAHNLQRSRGWKTS